MILVKIKDYFFCNFEKVAIETHSNVLLKEWA
jgi:hypothetical protein